VIGASISVPPLGRRPQPSTRGASGARGVPPGDLSSDTTIDEARMPAMIPSEAAMGTL